MNRENIDAAKAFLKAEYAANPEMTVAIADRITSQLKSEFNLSLLEFDAVMHELTKERGGYDAVTRYDDIRKMIAFYAMKETLEAATRIIAMSDIGYDDMEKFNDRQLMQAHEEGACIHIIEVLQQMQVVLRRIRRAKVIMHHDIEKYINLSTEMLRSHGESSESH